jgi:hypothetical protein
MFKMVWLLVSVGFAAFVYVAFQRPVPTPVEAAAPKPYDPSAEICVGFSDSAEGRAAQDRCVGAIRRNIQAWLNDVPEFGEPEYADACPPHGARGNATRGDIECLSQFVAMVQWLKRGRN